MAVTPVSRGAYGWPALRWPPAGASRARTLQPVPVQAACDAKGLAAKIRTQDGYDHSYYFISTFIDEHIAHHAAFLK